MDLKRIVSGFPQIMTDILSELSFEDLLEMRLVSTGLYQFLMEDKQVWIGIFTKTYTNLLENNEDWRFPLKLSPSFETKEEMRRALKQQWMDVFDKITKIASIPRLMRMCQLFSRAPKNFGALLGALGIFCKVPKIVNMFMYSKSESQPILKIEKLRFISNINFKVKILTTINN